MRYLPHTERDREVMLEKIGVRSIEDLFADIPEASRIADLVDLPRHQSELEIERQLTALAGRNVAAGSVPFFVGCGAYRHHIPATVDHLIQRSEFLTSYTPYQPEISQGTLQYLFEFQTQVALLTGMEVANASMYDGSTACAEAILMAHRIAKRDKALLSGGLHAQHWAVARTISKFSDHRIVEMPPDPKGEEDLAGAIDEETSCVVVQYPSLYGGIKDLSAIAEAAHAKGALLIAVVTEIVSLGALRSPGEMGADIVVCEGQGIGNGLNFGGPYVGFFATRQKYVRQMPGRLSGETVDVDGRRGYVLTMSAREQHIRREKATSNICTNSGLCALAFTIHLSLLGEIGLKRLATLNHFRAVSLAEMLSEIEEVDLVTPNFFIVFTLSLPVPAAQVVDELVGKSILGGVPVSRLEPMYDEGGNLLIVAATETNSEADCLAYAKALREVLG